MEYELQGNLGEKVVEAVACHNFSSAVLRRFAQYANVVDVKVAFLYQTEGTKIVRDGVELCVAGDWDSYDRACFEQALDAAAYELSLALESSSSFVRACIYGTSHELWLGLYDKADWKGENEAKVTWKTRLL